MITNFFRVTLPFESFQIQRLLYSDERFATLRKEHNKDASFFRHGEFIYHFPPQRRWARASVAAEERARRASLYFGDLLHAKLREFNPLYREAEGASIGQWQRVPSVA